MACLSTGMGDPPTGWRPSGDKTSYSYPQGAHRQVIGLGDDT